MKLLAAEQFFCLHQYYTPNNLVIQGRNDSLKIFVKYHDFYVNAIMLTKATLELPYFRIESDFKDIGFRFLRRHQILFMQLSASHYLLRK